MKIEDVIHTKFKSPQQKAIVSIRFTSNYLGNIQSHVLDKYGLTMPQFNILRILRGAKGVINVNTVKDRMVEKSPNTTRLMDKLIEKGMIERIRCENDRRIVYVNITKEGLKLLKKIDKDDEVEKLIEANLSEEESDLLCELLEKVRENYGKHC